MTRKELKIKLRDIKKQEIIIRGDKKPLVWSTYFSESENNPKAKYTLEVLYTLDDAERKHVIADYFTAMYLFYYKETGQSIADMIDPSVLSLFGLPAMATKEDVKKRFWELAQLHHPDKGGDVTVFRVYLDAYEQVKQM